MRRGRLEHDGRQNVRRGKAPHRQRSNTVAPNDAARTKLGRDVGDFAQRNAGAGRRRHERRGGDIVHPRPLGAVEPERDVEIALPFPEGGDGRSGERPRELHRDVRVGETKTRRDLRPHVQPERELLVAPVGVNVCAARRVLEDLRDAVAIGPQQAGIVADETNLVRRREHRSLLQRLDVHPPFGRDPVDLRVQTIDERVRRFGRRRVDQQLAEVWRGRFRVVIVIEARSATAGECGNRAHARLPMHRISQPTQHLVRAGEPSAGRHPQIDDELIALVHREEAVRHRRHQRETCDERHHGADHRQTLARHGHAHHALVHGLHDVEGRAPLTRSIVAAG